MTAINKIDALYEMVKASEKGEIDTARKIQRALVSSIREDNSKGVYNDKLPLDRRSKKALKGVFK